MAFRKKSKGNDKYLRLTGLWQSKSNDELWTGRLKADQLEDLLKRVEEAIENDAPIVFSLWENGKKESKRDPDFSLQCFVGDAEESPRSSRNSRSSGSSRRSNREDNDEDEKGDDRDEGDGDEEEDKSNRKGKTSKRSGREESSKKRSSGW